MLLLNWWNHVWSWNRRRKDQNPPKERRLRLMRLEQRRVLNADAHFLFTPHDKLTLSNVDADLKVSETVVSGTEFIQFELSQGSGTIWTGSGPVSLSPDGRVLSVSAADFDGLSMASISAKAATHHDINLDAAARSLNLTADSLSIDHFENLPAETRAHRGTPSAS